MRALFVSPASSTAVNAASSTPPAIARRINAEAFNPTSSSRSASCVPTVATRPNSSSTIAACGSSDSSASSSAAGSTPSEQGTELELHKLVSQRSWQRQGYRNCLELFLAPQMMAQAQARTQSAPPPLQTAPPPHPHDHVHRAHDTVHPSSTRKHSHSPMYMYIHVLVPQRRTEQQTKPPVSLIPLHHHQRDHRLLLLQAVLGLRGHSAINWYQPACLSVV